MKKKMVVSAALALCLSSADAFAVVNLHPDRLSAMSAETETKAEL